MNTDDSVRFGMVGAGAIAQAYATSFGQCDTAQLVAVCDCRIDAAQALAEAGHCAAFECVEAMCDEMDLEAVLVATPPATHADICKQLFGRGIHVLCEKPLATHPAEADDMIEASADADVIFTMASKFRYTPDLVEAKALLASGTIGELQLLENVFSGRVDMSSRWNSDPAISGGGVLIDNGTHSVDVARFLAGEIVEVSAIEGLRIQGLEVEDSAVMLFRNARGAMGSVDLSWSVAKPIPYYVALHGTAGQILVGWQESRYKRNVDSDWTVFGHGYNKFEAFKNQIANFAAAVRGREPLCVTLDDALASVNVIAAAYESMGESRWQRVAETAATKSTP